MIALGIGEGLKLEQEREDDGAKTENSIPLVEIRYKDGNNWFHDKGAHAVYSSN